MVRFSGSRGLEFPNFWSLLGKSVMLSLEEERHFQKGWYSIYKTGWFLVSLGHFLIPVHHTIDYPPGKNILEIDTSVLGSLVITALDGSAI